MNLENLIGKVFLVRIIEKENNWYICETIKENKIIYIEDTGDFLEEELINTIEKCVITSVNDDNLIGFFLSNRKFINDIRKINKKLLNTEEYPNIKDIYLIERLKIKGKIVGLYLVDEGEIAKYYLDTIEIGTYIKKNIENNILFKENTLANEITKQIKDVVQSIDLNKKEISLREEELKRIHLIQRDIGLEREREITKIATVDLDKTIKYQEELKNYKIIQENAKMKNLLNKQYSKEKDVNIKQEMELKDKVTDMKTLEKVLEDNNKLPNLEGKKFIKLGIIESDERDNLLNKNKEKSRANTTRYSFVAIASDGTTIPLDLEQDYTEGNNPRETNYQISQNGKIKQDDVLSRFKIGNGTFAVKNGEYGEIKLYHSPRKTIGGNKLEGNKSLDRELETDNVWEMKKEERDIAGEYSTGYRSVEEGYQEAKMHEDESGSILDNDKMKTKDIDGDRQTKSHIHDNVDYDKLAVRWGYYRDGQPNEEKAKEIFIEKRKENPKKETKEIIEMVEEELEEQMGFDRETR